MPHWIFGYPNFQTSPDSQSAHLGSLRSDCGTATGPWGLGISRVALAAVYWPTRVKLYTYISYISTKNDNTYNIYSIYIITHVIPLFQIA